MQYISFEIYITSFWVNLVIMKIDCRVFEFFNILYVLVFVGFVYIFTCVSICWVCLYFYMCNCWVCLYQIIYIRYSRQETIDTTLLAPPPPDTNLWLALFAISLSGNYNQYLSLLSVCQVIIISSSLCYQSVR